MLKFMRSIQMNRREFLAVSAASATKIERKSSADTCIFVWLPGGMCHVDTFDPKRKGNGESIPGSYYDAIKTSVPGVEICEHLPLMAQRMQRFTVIRTLNHQFTDHTRAVDFTHTGRVASGTIVYPSIGSIAAHELGGFDPKAPAYVVIGEPMQPRGPGFLGGKANYMYITDTEAGPAGLQIPKGLTAAEYDERLTLLRQFSNPYLEARKDARQTQEYVAVAERGFAMMDQKFQSAFTVKEESAALREAYGEEFGQRLLLSRRLVERGIRFVECSFNIKFLNGYGWDTHAFAQKRVHLMIRQLDRAITALVDDLDRRKMFDRTLIVLATEFGRPPEFDGSGGRGHHADAFCGVMFGGGVKGGTVIGATDELGKKPIHSPISIPDFHATIYRALGIPADKNLFTPEGRPVPVTDYGKPIEALYS
jgi:Protein of unknown function (DUF1501)